MENKHVKELLVAYIDGELDAQQKEALEIHLKHCDTCSKELKDLKALLKVLKNEEMIQPSNKIRTNFNEALEHEKHQISTHHLYTSKTLSLPKIVWPVLKVAASIVFLVSAFLLGRYQNSSATNQVVSAPISDKDTSKKEILLGLMEDISASKRIQGVHTVSEFEHPDESIVNALIDRMLHDQNTNVRLTALEVLTRFTSSETVKDAFVKALKSEKDPLLQIRIIKTLVKIQEKKAIAPMRYLLDQKDTEPFVKEQLKSLLPIII